MTVPVPIPPFMTSPSATPTPAQYVTGWVKQDLNATLAVAIRTGIVTANNMKDWGVMTTDHGGHYATWDDVATWPDIDAQMVVMLNVGFSGDGAVTAGAADVEEIILVGFNSEGQLDATVTTQRARKQKT